MPESATEILDRLDQYVPSVVSYYRPVNMEIGMTASIWYLTIVGVGERVWSTSEVAAFLDGLDAAVRIASVP